MFSFIKSLFLVRFVRSTRNGPTMEMKCAPEVPQSSACGQNEHYLCLRAVRTQQMVHVVAERGSFLAQIHMPYPFCSGRYIHQRNPTVSSTFTHHFTEPHGSTLPAESCRQAVTRVNIGLFINWKASIWVIKARFPYALSLVFPAAALSSIFRSVKMAPTPYQTYGKVVQIVY